MKNLYEIRGDVTAIFLTNSNGKTLETVIETKDLPKADSFPMTWYANWHKDISSFYVYGNTKIKNGKRTIVTLHRWLLDPPDKLVVDHINHDTLDNRRSNLRLVTVTENNLNRKNAPLRNNKYSKHRWVIWKPAQKKWLASMRYKGKYYYLGYHDDELVAAKVAMEARIRIIGENFNQE